MATNKVYPDAVAALSGVLRDDMIVMSGGFGLCGIASNLIDLQEAANALNQVLSTTVSLLNSSTLGIQLGGGFDTRPQATTEVLQLHVAPVHLDLLGTLVNTSPIEVSHGSMYSMNTA